VAQQLEEVYERVLSEVRAGENRDLAQGSRA
jgi:hypothetical protein